jgi:hypothetical protein
MAKKGLRFAVPAGYAMRQALYAQAEHNQQRGCDDDHIWNRAQSLHAYWIA